MTQDEIIEMARQAGFDTDLQVFKDGTAIAITLAKLVAAKERDTCAKAVDAMISIDEDWDTSYWNQAINRCADAIRARGEA